MRYLGIDLGQKRTGIAVGDDETMLVSPLKVIQHQNPLQLLDALNEVVNQHRPDAVVIGLPLNMDGTEGAAARQVREFAAQFQQRTALTVHFQDERLTSYAADKRMAQSGRTHKQKKQLRDALAAAELLSDFLEQKKQNSAS